MWIVTDSETGGLNPDINPLLIAYFGIATDDGIIVDERYYRIKPAPDMLVTAEALNVNKINLLDHHSVAQDIETVRQDLVAFVAPYAQLTCMGWNVHFDLGFYYKQLLTRAEWEKHVSYRVMDVQVLARFFFNKGKLEDTARYLNVEINAHDAKADALATLQVYKVIEQRYKPKD